MAIRAIQRKRQKWRAFLIPLGVAIVAFMVIGKVGAQGEEVKEIVVGDEIIAPWMDIEMTFSLPKSGGSGSLKANRRPDDPRLKEMYVEMKGQRIIIPSKVLDDLNYPSLRGLLILSATTVGDDLEIILELPFCYLPLDKDELCTRQENWVEATIEKFGGTLGMPNAIARFRIRNGVLVSRTLISYPDWYHPLQGEVIEQVSYARQEDGSTKASGEVER